MIKNYFAHRADIPFTHFRPLLEDITSRYPENHALLFRTGPEQYDIWNYKRLLSEVNILGTALLKAGFLPGDNIGLLSENRPEWCVTYLAAVCAGLVIVPFDVLTSEENLENIAGFSDIKALFISQQQSVKLGAFSRAADQLSKIISFDPGEDSVLEYYADLLATEDEGDFTPFKFNGEDALSIIFTSGTTGTPKGVTLSHNGVISNINASIMSLPIYSTDNFVAVLPFHHTYPTTCSFLSPISVGGRVTIVDKIVGPVIIANVKETSGTHIIGVPLLFDKISRGMNTKFRDLKGFKGFMVRTLLALSRLGCKLHMNWGKALLKSVRAQAGLGSIRLLVAGGGPLSPFTSDFFQVMGFDIVQGYGMSENGPLISTNTVKYNEPASVGLSVKRTEIQLREKNSEGIGQIVVRSPSLMKGYYKNPEATKKTFTEDGFLKTGDLGRFDSRGFLYITGRMKNLIVSPAGKNIYPEEIEACFSSSEIMGDILVVGKPVSEKNRGEEVMALCRPDFEFLEQLYKPEDINDDSLTKLMKDEVDRVNKMLEPHKKIKHVVLHKDEFEKTSSQKIKRFLYSGASF